MPKKNRVSITQCKLVLLFVSCMTVQEEKKNREKGAKFIEFVSEDAEKVKVSVQEVLFGPWGTLLT